MKLKITNEYIYVENAAFDNITFTFNSSTIVLTPCGYVSRFHDIDAKLENGYIYNKAIIDLFHLRGLDNTEIELIGPVSQNGTFVYMAMNAFVDREKEEEILENTRIS